MIERLRFPRRISLALAALSEWLLLVVKGDLWRFQLVHKPLSRFRKYLSAHYADRFPAALAFLPWSQESSMFVRGNRMVVRRGRGSNAPVRKVVM